MLKIPKLHALTVALCCVIAQTGLVANVEDELTIRPYVDTPSFSPDGSHLAMMTTDPFGHRMLAVTDCEKVSTDIIKVIDHDNPDPRWQVKNITEYHWLDNERLVVVSDLNADVNTLHYVKRNGGSTPELLKYKSLKVLDANPETSEAIVCLLPGYEYGEVRVVAIGPDHEERELYRCESSNFQAFTDKNHELRLVRRDESKGGPQAWFAKDRETGEWKKLSLEAWATVFGVDFNPDIILVGSHHDSPFPAVQMFNIAEDKFVANLIKHPRFAMDKAATPLFSKQHGGMVGMHIDANFPTPVWMNKDFKVFQASMDNLFKDSKNRIVCWDDMLNYLLVERIVGDQPARYVLVNNVKGKADVLWVSGSVDLGEEDTAECKFVPIKTRDGVFLDSYVTLPRNKKKGLPLVVLVDEDPFNKRSLYGWNNEAQYLAYQGYAVLQLNFRGSGGMIGDCKNDFENVDAVKQIFRDYEDAIQVLAEKYGIDAKRVAFVGKGGAGGWIATYAQVAIPDSVKCSWALSGVYDLYQYRHGKDKEAISNLGQIPFAHEGGALSDEDLSELSPMMHTSDMHGSLQLCYGSWNPESFKDHQYKFSKEAKNGGVSVEKNVVRDFYGTNINDLKSYREVLRALKDFLKKHL